MPLVLKSLDAVSSDGAGEVLEIGFPKATYILQYTASGSIGGGTIYLEGSLDGENFAVRGQQALAAGTFHISASGYPVTHLRARLAGVSGSPVVSAIVAFLDDQRVNYD